MSWSDVKSQIQVTLRARDLASPPIRLNALETLERLLKAGHPEVLRDPNCILEHARRDIEVATARHKANGRLNSAEKSVLTNVYQVVSGQGMTQQRQVRVAPHKVSVRAPKTQARRGSDEHYVIDICDRVLKRSALRQHRFDFLRGDAKEGGVGVRLPVDAYYPDLNLIVEHRERQHTEEVDFFDKPDRLTVSGVH